MRKIGFGVLWSLSLLSLFCSVSCRTTGKQNGSQVAGGVDEGAGEAASALTSQAAAPIFSKEEDQSLYLKMLGVELAASIKVPKDQLHTSRGLFECHHDGSLDTCALRVRLLDDTVSSTQPLAPSLETLSAKIWTFVRSARPDLGQEKVVLSDVVCDYVGKASPPYNVEDVRCSVAVPHAVNEAVFSGKAAEDMSDALRGDAALGNGTTVVNGTISCLWPANSPRTPCVIRSIQNGVVQDKITELSGGVAAETAHSLLRTAHDTATLTADASASATTGAAAAIFKAPTEVTSALTCTIDSSAVASDGPRQFGCRSRL